MMSQISHFKTYTSKVLGLAVIISVFTVACDQKKQDGGLDGMWSGEVIVSAATVAAVDQQQKETYIYSFADEDLSIYRTKNSDLDNNIEVEVGKYEREKDLITYKITAHSCVNAEKANYISKKPSEKSFTYDISDDFKQVTIGISVNKKLVLKKLESGDLKSAEKLLSISTTGCYIPSNGTTPGGFKPAPISNPKTL